MAEISVPAWPIPIHQTKLMMAKPQPIGMLMPQMPVPRTNKVKTQSASRLTKQNEMKTPTSHFLGDLLPRQIDDARDALRYRGISMTGTDIGAFAGIWNFRWEPLLLLVD